MNNTNDALLPPNAADNGGGGSLAVEALVIAAALIACILRFYTRFMTKAGLGADDWFMLVAVTTTLATAALLLAGDSVDPVGAWVADHPNPAYVYTEADQLYLKLSFVSSLLYFTIAASTKLGILCMYYRIFALDDQFRRSMYVIGFLVITWLVSSTLATLANCVPLEYSWLNGFSDPKYCFNFNLFWMATGIIEVVLDVLILALPVKVVLGLRLSKKKKITVIGIFLLGGFTVITGIVRVVLGYIPGSRTPSYSQAEVWTTVHTGMAIICACLPIYWPLIKKIRDSRFGKRLVRMGRFCLCCSSRRRKSQDQSVEPLNSHEMSDSLSYAEKDSNRQGDTSYPDSRDLHTSSSSSSRRSLLSGPLVHDLESAPEPAWQARTRHDRSYARPTKPKIPSFVRLTLNLDDAPLSLDELRRQSTLIPDG